MKPILRCHLDVIVIYRSTDGSLDRLVNKLECIMYMSKSTLVIRAMNTCNKKIPMNDLLKFLEDQTYKQIIKKATHINHAYIINMGNFGDKPGIIQKYLCHHDAICISWKTI